MTHPPFVLRTGLFAGLAVLAGCSDMDFDLRGNTGGFSTSQAALQATTDRPQPDSRGVISYPNYQVVVAQRGDTVVDVARRLGVDAAQLGAYNGVPTDAVLRNGEVLALPGRVAEPSPATGAAGTGPIRPAGVDVTTLAGAAIDRSQPAAPGTPRVARVSPQTGVEPVRHRVKRGETAYSIARLYSVPVQALAQWNGLSPRFDVREGQYLLIPVAEPQAPEPVVSSTAPGQGSPTPTPPSAQTPLPADETPPAAQQTAPVVQADLGEATKAAPTGRLAYPVEGTVIREYAKGRNDGINIKAAPGTAVKAAGSGTVAAITESADGVPIIVVRHEENLLTVYANVTDVSVKKGDPVSRGQSIARLRDGDQSFVHFEVRQGFESADPSDFLGG